MTTIATRRRARRHEPPSDARVAAVSRLLDRAIAGGLKLRVDREQAHQALLQTFNLHPIGSKTARLVGEALGGRIPDQDRPPEQRACRKLVASGQVPHPRAIEATIAHELAGGPRRERLAQIAERDGPAAARAVAGSWRRYRCSLSPLLLARQLGWRPNDAYGICHHLIAQGWLALDHRKRLQLGSRARY
jgi:hypothetical protein